MNKKHGFLITFLVSCLICEGITALGVLFFAYLYPKISIPKIVTTEMSQETTQVKPEPEITQIPFTENITELTVPVQTPTVDFPDQIMVTQLVPTPDKGFKPTRWAEWPVIPTLSVRAKQVYQNGLKAGNNPHAFSVIGDCMSYPYLFMGIFDSMNYKLRWDHKYLQETINQFRGSFARQSVTVKNGLNPPGVLSPLWADPSVCGPNESPVECELRIHRPTFVFINLGTNWTASLYTNSYEEYLRQIVDIVIEHGAVPILSTKADNQEKDNSVNLATAKVAYETEMPLWNFWLSSQDLLFGGLDPEHDNVYLSKEGYGLHSSQGLVILDALWKQTR